MLVFDIFGDRSSISISVSVSEQQFSATSCASVSSLAETFSWSIRDCSLLKSNLVSSKTNKSYFRRKKLRTGLLVLKRI